MVPKSLHFLIGLGLGLGLGPSPSPSPSPSPTKYSRSFIVPVGMGISSDLGLL